jgi:3-oxoacyl-[acyl-carrier protein] reductase
VALEGWRVTRALVLGGSGHVGAHVLAGLRAAGVPAWFTYLAAEARAHELARQHDHTARRVDLREPAAIAALCAELVAADAVPDAIIHLAAHPDWRALGAVDQRGWDDVQHVAVRAPFLLLSALAPHLGDASVVLVAGLSAIRPVPAPPQAAAAHAGLAGLTRSLARALGPRTRVNLAALGILDGGTAGRIDPRYLSDHPRFAALARNGTAAEAARAILWLALDNRYMSGALVNLSGGI